MARDEGSSLSESILGPAYYAELKSQLELTQDPAHLRIDSSLLPLELFDSLRFQESDKTPEEWLATGYGGTVPFCENGEWVRKPCKVLDYDANTCKFRVKILANKAEKYVSRLNLKFEAEDEQWEERVGTARAAQQHAKALIRYDHFVSQQSNDEIRPIQPKTINNIHAKLLNGLSAQVQLADHKSAAGKLLKESMTEVIRWYTRAMKIAILTYKLRHGDEVIHKYAKLGLPEIPPLPPVPETAMVECASYPRRERNARLAQLHISNQYSILLMFSWLYSKWSADFSSVCLMDVELKGLAKPCQLVEFEQMQLAYREKISLKLQRNFRRAFMEQFVDTVQDLYDLFQSNRHIFMGGPLYRLLRGFDLRIVGMLRSLLTESIAGWVKFVERNCQSALGDAAEGTPQRADKIHATSSLFTAELVVEDATVELQPSLQEIQDYLLNQLDHAIRITRDLTAIDSDVMSLLQLPRRVLLNVGVEDPLFGDVDSIISTAKSHLTNLIDQQLAAPRCLIEDFQQFGWLQETEVKDLLQQFSDAEHRPSIDDYRAKLRELHTAAERVGTVSYDVEDFGLIRIEATNVKQQLMNRALELRNALLEHMMTVIHEQTTAVIQEYTAILDRIAEKPKDERELAELRQFIEDSKVTIAGLQQRTEMVRDMFSVSDEFCHRPPLELLGLFWSTLEYPSTIDAAATDAEIALEGDKVRMMDELALEKEKFDTDIEALAQAVKGAKEICNYDLKEASVDAVNTLMDKIHDAQAKAADFNMREGVFGFPPTEYGVLDTLIEELNPFYKLWNMVADFHSSQQDWLHGPFQELDGKKIEEYVTDWWKTSYKLAKQLEGDAQGASECAMRLREETAEFKTRLPVIQALASKALKRRHWDLLSEQLGHVIDPDEDLTLQYLFEIKAAENMDSILEVTQAAEKEYNLEKSLAAMRQEWASIEFDVRPYKTTAVIGGLDDIITLLDDHLVKAQTMRGSPYIRPIEAECKAWEFRLKYAQSLLDAWLACQRTWMYLEPIFAAEDIMRQLPTEARRFSGVDNLWRKTMSDALADANFMHLADPEKNLESKFAKANEKLEEIQKGLTDYLEMKRLAFPRFFFLSDEGLLEILSQTKNSKAVQPYLSSIFEGIASVTFADDLKITEGWSAEGELLPLQRFVDPESTANKGNVERWLLELESIQWDSVRHQTTLALEEYTALPRVQWVLNWPAQVVLAVSQVYWTREVTAALTGGGGSTALAKLHEFLNSQLRDIVQLVRGKLTKLERKTLTALTTIDVHARDVVQGMVDVRVQSVGDFEWVSQLRYYWEPSWRDGQGVKKGQDTLVARIVNARCLYGYEYLGNTTRLVITPLTDRCYRTMIGAVDLLYGGAPEGPAGTGKTETVKDLSKAVAIHCVVFNCSDGLDYLAMAKFFKGLAGCGSWCCFDEFNRIHIEVLSVIAQQILEITNAKRENKVTFYFEGTHMKLNMNCNVFITMNPGYAGRAELPDNLKALFRPCAMMVPDYALISEIRLYSFGFEDARSNAQKIVRVLQLSSEQLSSQKHYDYGMRAVNSILVAAGNLRQELGNDPEWTEAKIVLRSINDVNLPKFTVEDLPLFYGITSDLFPQVNLPQKNHGCLPRCIHDACKEGVEFLNGSRQQLEPTPQFTKKILELYEMILVRHGVMVVGETGSGKSATICGLAQAMTTANAESSQFPKVQIHAMNPKAVTCDQLYGYSDLNSHEWTDGVLAVIFRTCAKDTSPDRKWVLFDGPVDAVWIENMNTVLDDNKKLCLMSGEIIKMNDAMTMMFEAEDLEQASPATISRVGMIFCEAANIGWQALLSTWLRRQDEVLVSHHDTITRLCNWLFEPLIFCVDKFCARSVPLTTQESMQSLLTLFGCFVNHNLDRVAKGGGEVLKILEGLFVLAMIWSLGASVEKVGRVVFEQVLRKILASDTDTCREYQEFIAKAPKFHQQARATVLVLPDTSLYDHVFDPTSCRWVSWYEGQSRLTIPANAAFHDIVVPTVDSIRNEHMIKLLLLNGHHVLCTGETGTGKSVSLRKLLRAELPETYQSISLSFSAQTGANQVQDLIDSKLDKRRKGVFGPPLGHKSVVFVDDLNMPAKEQYGAQPPIELLRQWMDQGGWYDRSDNSFRKLVDICFVAAMGPPGGGRSRITQRYVRHFNLLNFVPFNDESLARVFGTILEWHLDKGFAASVKQMTNAIVSGTIAVYNKTIETLLPTPTKSHYTFNLRDMSKVFQGISQGNSEHVREKADLVQLWLHESMRVFHDRLINVHDREWFVSCLTSTCTEVVKPASDTVLKDVPSLLYGNFADPKATTKVYQKVDDLAQLQLTMQGYLDDHNAVSRKPMNLVLFRNAIEHIARISRIINQPYGNALLIGVGGSGRKSLTKLAVHVAEFELFEIEISKNYGRSEWREDIKAMMMKAGVENKSTVFLFDDTQIVLPSFLEDINGILNSGEVANLFKPDELAQLPDLLSKPGHEAGINLGSQTEVYNFFIARCRSNLHVVLCLSPIGEAFRTRLRMFPSLVNCCTIDWFTAWPEEALRSVAQHFLREVDLEDNVKDGIVTVCVTMQEKIIQMSDKYLKEMGRHFYVTPTSYLELINTFQRMLAGQRAQVLELKYRYENGLSKLRETEVQVAEMQRELEDLQPKLHDAKAATEELLKQIEADRIVANEKRTVVEAEEAICNQQKSEAEELKASCEAELAEALPAWEDATRALRNLSKNDIVEIKSMKKPVNAVKVVLQSVCIMMGVRAEKIKDPAGGPKKVEDYWGPAQKHLLGDARLIQRLIEYDKDNIDPEIIEKITTFVNDPEFDPDFVRTKSVAAAGLCKWVHAMVKYDRVVKVVAPKRRALAEAEAALKVASDALAEKQAMLKEVIDKLQALEQQLQEAEEKKRQLQNQVTECATKLNRAEALITGLGGEKTRWAELSAQLIERYQNITGDIMLAAGVIAFLGAFTNQYREAAIAEWSSLLRARNITCSDKFSLRTVLGDEVVIRNWVICKLPNDSFSIMNAIMLSHSNRWPLMIDPQGQANRWIKKMEEDNKLKVVKQNQATFVRTIENSIQFGNPVLLENVGESIDPILDSVLLKHVVTVGGSKQIRLGDNTIDYDERFRLYITTKLSNPHYPPELCVKVNLLNFMATAEGLEDQMLGRVVAREQPELEAQRQALILEDAQNKRQLKDIEDKILDKLSHAEGNILDDEMLIDTLAASKKTSNVIEEKMKVATATQQRIARIRQGYLPVAFQSSQLFFCIADLAGIDPMYQYSLEWFMAIFDLAIEKAPKCPLLEDRLKSLNDTFTHILYQNVCRSLFEKDKLLFSFLLTVNILRGRGELDAQQLRFFLQGSTSMELSEPNPVPHSWLSDRCWSDILALAELPSFREFLPAFKANITAWKSVFESPKPTEVIRAIMGEEMALFGELCVLRAFRPDAVVPAIQAFIANKMGEQFIEPPPLDLRACFEDSHCTTPLIFVLTPGADPMSALLSLAAQLGYANKLTSISLGQGQGPLAENAIAEAGDKGHWVCLQNCHLSISWMPTLERLCEEFSDETLHPNFRLWLTSEPSPHFPSYILQSGVKMTNEPAKGMRANLLGSYIAFEDAWLNGCARQAEFKKLVFGLCFFHAVVRERRKFGPLGWNIQYVFSGPDLKISLDQLRLFLDELGPDDPIPYPALAYLAGECNYGGRVTDDKDRRCLVNILSEFYCSAIQDDEYKFSPSGQYFAPPEGDLESYKAYIRSLPYTEDPEVFGLHDNANISCALAETNTLLSTALSLQGRTASGDGASWEEKLTSLAGDIQDRLPPQFDIEAALLAFPIAYEESMNTVLTQELLRFNTLMAIMKSSLDAVGKALKGLVVLSAELEAMGNAMVLGQVPRLWADVAYPSLKPLSSWVGDLLARLKSLQDWLDRGSSPTVYWISGFFFTQAFITGVLQNYARKYRIPIDQVAFDFRVLSDNEMKHADIEAPLDGAHVRGLFLEGARWDKAARVVAEAFPRELHAPMPYIHLEPKLRKDVAVIKGVPELYTGSRDGTAHVYSCPVYKTSIRQGVLSTTGHSTNFVMYMRLPLSLQHDQKHWIKRGVALLTQLDD